MQSSPQFGGCFLMGEFEVSSVLGWTVEDAGPYKVSSLRRTDSHSAPLRVWGYFVKLYPFCLVCGYYFAMKSPFTFVGANSVRPLQSQTNFCRKRGCTECPPTGWWRVVYKCRWRSPHPSRQSRATFPAGEGYCKITFGYVAVGVSLNTSLLRRRRCRTYS